ncbi:MAG: SIS domain-containing protein [Fimbriimonadaceae bacterium]
MSLDAGRRVFEQEAAALAELGQNLGSAFEETIRALLACEGRAVCCGLGKSGLIAQKASSTFASTGTPSVFLHAAEALHGDLGLVKPEDVVIAYSYSGEGTELVQVGQAVRVIGAKIVSITGRPDSTLARASDIVLDVGVRSEACPLNLAPTTSTTAMLALSDALAVATMESRGFTATDFARFHPAGTLGRRLILKVADVMRTGDDIAVVQEDASVMETMRAITRAGAGAAIVVDGTGSMTGLVSDGDLRRWFESGGSAVAGTATELMTRDPASVSPEMLAMEGLEFMENFPKKIGEVPVVFSGRPVGILMLKDLVRSGLI